MKTSGKINRIIVVAVVVFIAFSVVVAALLSTRWKTETDFVQESVVQTLVFIQLQRTLTPDYPSQADEPEAGFSVEITQEVFEQSLDVQNTNTELPEEYFIDNIWGHRQYFPIGCEASAATDWAKFYGVDINEFNFQYQLPKSDNPDKGFVGSVDGPWGQVPPYAYGVHAAPVAQVLRDFYNIPAAAKKGFTLDELKHEIARNQPVIAWVIGNVVLGFPYEYVDSEGESVVVAAYEHVVIVTGYSEKNIRYMNNGKFYEIPIEYFERSWNVLGNMVLYYND